MNIQTLFTTLQQVTNSNPLDIYGVRKEHSPRVWQRALSNFYVEYELVMNLDHPEQRVQILSELHTHIQDVFNEAGVQIMVPAFESQPEKKVIVPKAQWFPNHSRLTKS